MPQHLQSFDAQSDDYHTLRDALFRPSEDKHISKGSSPAKAAPSLPKSALSSPAPTTFKQQKISGLIIKQLRQTILRSDSWRTRTRHFERTYRDSWKSGMRYGGGYGYGSYSSPAWTGTYNDEADFDSDSDSEASWPGELQWPGVRLFPGTSNFTSEFMKTYGSESDDQVKCGLLMHSNLFGRFLLDELDIGDELWDLVILTKHAAHDPTMYRPQSLLDTSPDHHKTEFWATTCGDYVATRWPACIEHIRCLFKLLASPKSDSALTKMKISGSPETVSTIETTIDASSLQVKIETSAALLTDLVEAIAWLLAVVQNGSDVVPGAVRLLLETMPCGSGELLFKMYSRSHTIPAWPPETSCWLTMFPQTPYTTSAWGYIHHSNMKGVQMSFDLMCVLGGLQYESIEDGGIVLYGLKSLAYPVVLNTHAVQWHFEPFDPKEPFGELSGAARLKIVDLAGLREKRFHYVGLWKDAKVTLGSDMFDYSTLAWSEASEVSSESLRHSYTMGGSIQLPKVLQLNWSQQYKVAKSRRNQYLVNFEADLHRMIGVPVLLYSPAEKRGWLVSYVSVLLHLVKARAFVQRDLGFRMPGCAEAGNSGFRAFEILKANYRRPLKQPEQNEEISQEEQQYTIGNYVEEVRAAMELARRETCRAKGALHTLREKIIGFEMADIAKMKPFLRMKQHALSPLSSSCWAPLLEDIQYAFFYEGLSDAILPGPEQQFSQWCECGKWRSVPPGHNLLTASLPILAAMAEDRNPVLLTQLTANHYWHTPDGLFQECKQPGNHICSRLQEIRSTGRSCTSPAISCAEARQNGAVVFKYKDGIGAIMEAQRSTRSTEACSPYHGNAQTELVPYMERRVRSHSAGGTISDSGYSSTRKSPSLSPRTTLDTTSGQKMPIFEHEINDQRLHSTQLESGDESADTDGEARQKECEQTISRDNQQTEEQPPPADSHNFTQNPNARQSIKEKIGETLHRKGKSLWSRLLRKQGDKIVSEIPDE